MKKSLFVGFYGDEGKSIIEMLSSKVNFSILDIIGSVIEIPNTDQIFVPKKKFRNGEFDFREVLGLKELDPGLWEAMALYEIEFYKQIDRLALTHQVESYRSRYEFYKQSVKYFYSLISNRSYDLVIMSNVPHLMYDMVIYGLCKSLNVPVLCFYRTPIITDEFFYLYTFESLKDHRQREIEHWQNQYLKSGGKKSIAVKSIISAWRRNTVEGEGVVPEPPSLSVALSKTLSYVHTLDSISGRRRAAISYLPIQRRPTEQVKRLKNSSLYLQALYDAISTTPNLSCNYVYLPLHKQPEATSQPLGGIFQDQLLVASLLAERIPEDWFVFVKEFPDQDGLNRTACFYDELKANPRIKLIDRRHDTVALMKNAKAVATLTGTVAWEAFYSKVPAIVFGETIIEAANGVFKVESKGDLDKALTQIQSARPITLEEDVEAFSYALDRVCFKGYLEPYKAPVKNSDFSLEENTVAIVREISKRIKEVAGED